MKKTRKIVKFRIFLWLILACFTGWLLYMGIVPSGKITYIYGFSKGDYSLAGPSKFIGKLTPAERVENINNGSQKIVGDPVYFSLYTPRKFEKAKASLTYKNESERPLVEMGVLVDNTIWRYQLEPIENQIIDKLATVWNVIEKDGVMLLQREKKYDTLDNFLANLPPAGEIALYNYDLKNDYLIADYQAGEARQEINYSLRGAYQFFTYLKSEDLDFNFAIEDLNKNTDSDPVDVNLYYNDKLISSRHSDDGEGTREINFKESNLPEGVYKIELRANDDIITKKISTAQSKISFLNKIWLADEGKSLSLFTDSQFVNAQTTNPASLQTLRIGDKEINIDKTYKQFSQQIGGDIKEIKIEKGDIIISGNGVFAFNQENLFNPNFKKVDESFSSQAEGTNYILARYKIPAEGEDGWREASAEFDLSNAYREWNKNSFIISVPGLRADDEIKDSLEIKEIKIELAGRTFLEKLKEVFK